VLLPDGRLQTVKYTVGKYGGYVAHVREFTLRLTVLKLFSIGAFV
jgi:hypothetical protein